MIRVQRPPVTRAAEMPSPCRALLGRQIGLNRRWRYPLDTHRECPLLGESGTAAFGAAGRDSRHQQVAAFPKNDGETGLRKRLGLDTDDAGTSR